MQIKPKLAYQHAGYLSNTALDPRKTYTATPATNQPHWRERGLVFVESANGAPEMLLSAAQYTVTA